MWYETLRRQMVADRQDLVPLAGPADAIPFLLNHTFYIGPELPQWVRSPLVP
jgi:hypothetical protein